MIVVLSDTHRTERPGVSGGLADAVRAADRVVHAGDFTTEAVLDGFQSVSHSLLAVHGNADRPAVTERLPAARTFDVAGLTVAVTHTQRGGATGLEYFGLERGADLVVSGHTHRPHVEDTGDLVLLNPGSHTDPRSGEPTYGVLESGTESGLEGRIETVDGTIVQEIRVEGRGEQRGGQRGTGRGDGKG